MGECSEEPVVTSCEEDQELALICHCTCAESIAAVHAYQTSQQVATRLGSKLYCGLEMILNLTAVMSGLPSSQHTQHLTELCSRYDETLTRKARTRCVEPSEGRLECKATSRCAVKSSLDKKCAKVDSCCYSHVEWGSYEIPRVN